MAEAEVASGRARARRDEERMGTQGCFCCVKAEWLRATPRRRLYERWFEKPQVQGTYTIRAGKEYKSLVEWRCSRRTGREG